MSSPSARFRPTRCSHSKGVIASLAATARPYSVMSVALMRATGSRRAAIWTRMASLVGRSPGGVVEQQSDQFVVVVKEAAQRH